MSFMLCLWCKFLCKTLFSLLCLCSLASCCAVGPFADQFHHTRRKMFSFLFFQLQDLRRPVIWSWNSVVFLVMYMVLTLHLYEVTWWITTSKLYYDVDKNLHKLLLNFVSINAILNFWEIKMGFVFLWYYPVSSNQRVNDYSPEVLQECTPYG